METLRTRKYVQRYIDYMRDLLWVLAIDSHGDCK
jgi:hypothetical protein